MPVVVEAYDRTNNVVTVTPLIQLVKLDGTTIQRNAYGQIPALALGGGGFFINFPLKQGDLGWILASDRDLSLFRQTLATAAPNTSRCHRFEDGWFIPDVFRKYTLNSADVSNDAMVISSTDGTTRISIWEDFIQITAPSELLVTSPQSTFSGSVTINENLTVLGTSMLTGQVTADADILVGSSGLSVLQHYHTAQGATANTTTMKA